MKEFWVILALLACVLFSQPSFGNIDSAYLGFNFDEVAGDRGWGLRGGSPFQTGVLEGHFDASLQDTGDFLRGKYELELGVPIGDFNAIMFNNGTVKGGSIAELGRQSDLGFKLRSPEADLGNWHFTADFGVFGRNGGVFASPNALSDLEGLGYTPETFEGLGLDAIGRPSRALSFKSDNSVNALVKTSFVHKSGVSLEAALQPELIGKGDNPVHQLILSATTSVKVWKLLFEIGLEWGFQTFDDQIEQERAGFGAWNIEF